ncbi:MAG: hypothetical protein AB8G26_18365 [Ilumatobacter sp.]
MLTAVVTTSHSAGSFQVNLLGAETCKRTDLEGDPEFATGSADCPELNPIAPEMKEVIWGGGAFIIMLIVIWAWLFPKVRAGMTARYDAIQEDRESAETLTAAARADVAEYEARLTSVRAEARQKVDAARATLESERSDAVAAANARLAERRAAAAAEVEQARQAAMGDVESAVSDVVARATEIATGRPATADAVQSAVRSAMGADAGVGS